MAKKKKKKSGGHTAYCVRCKKKRVMVKTKRGTMGKKKQPCIKGECPVCECGMNLIVARGT